MSNKQEQNTPIFKSKIISTFYLPSICSVLMLKISRIRPLTCNQVLVCKHSTRVTHTKIHKRKLSGLVTCITALPVMQTEQSHSQPSEKCLFVLLAVETYMRLSLHQCGPALSQNSHWDALEFRWMTQRIATVCIFSLCCFVNRALWSTNPPPPTHTHAPELGAKQCTVLCVSI